MLYLHFNPAVATNPADMKKKFKKNFIRKRNA